jgi:hypothetical protein
LARGVALKFREAQLQCGEDASWTMDPGSATGFARSSMISSAVFC